MVPALHYYPYRRHVNKGTYIDEPAVVKKGPPPPWSPLRLAGQKFRGGKTSDGHLVQGLDRVEATQKFPTFSHSLRSLHLHHTLQQSACLLLPDEHF